MVVRIPDAQTTPTVVIQPPAAPPPPPPPAAPPSAPPAAAPPDVLGRVIASGANVFTPSVPAAPVPPVTSPGTPDVIARTVASGQDVFVPSVPALPPEEIGGVSPAQAEQIAANYGLGESGGAGGGGVSRASELTDFMDAEAEALKNEPDLSGLPDWELLDPFATRALAVANPPLKGGGAVRAIAQACSDYGVDAFAAFANANLEGASGRIGDSGLAYGPFQDHLTEFRERPFYGRGKYNKAVNAWAWSENGIRYCVRAMVTGSPSARGLHGHAAVYAIVYGFEQPQDKRGAYTARAREYDKIQGLGTGWLEYEIGLMKGPTGVASTDTGITPDTPTHSPKPAGALAAWRELIGFFSDGIPARHKQVVSLADSLIEKVR